MGLLVVGDIDFVSLLIVGGLLLPSRFVGEFSPFDSGGLGDIGDSHTWLLDALTVLLHPEEEGGHGALRGVRVLGLSSLLDSLHWGSLLSGGSLSHR